MIVNNYNQLNTGYNFQGICQSLMVFERQVDIPEFKLKIAQYLNTIFCIDILSNYVASEKIAFSFDYFGSIDI